MVQGLLQPRMMKKMKQKNMIAFVTLTLLLSTTMAFADDIVLTGILSSGTYNPGDIVGISGNLTGVTAPVNVTIDILNGTDYALIDSFNASTVDSLDENLTATYDLTGAALGEYIVNITYGEYYVELPFEVEAVEPEDPEEPDEEDDCDDFSFAIERAEVYLDRVRGMLEGFADEYNESSSPEIYAKLQELNATLDIAEEYLANATIALEEGDCNTAARYHAAARNIMGRVKGLLNSVIKEHKVQKTERFMEQFQRRINSTQDKISQLGARLGTSNTTGVNAKLGSAWGQVKKLQGTVNMSNVDDILKNLKKNTDKVDDDLDDLGDANSSNAIRNMNKYQAKVRVLEKTASRLNRKGLNVTSLNVQLSNAESLMKKLGEQLKNGETDGIDATLSSERDAIKDALKNANKSQSNKPTSNNGKSGIAKSKVNLGRSKSKK